MPKEPLTKEEFEDWIQNHYQHLVKDVSEIKGKLSVLQPLSIATLAIIVSIIIAGLVFLLK